ncbi:hypothetical protein ANCDUO_25763, partial [Ancylostoma duodenale]
MLTAVSQGKLSFRQLVDRLHYNPKKIFGLPDQEDTYIEVDVNEEWTIPDAGGQSKCGWTPYAGMKVRGRVEKVVIRGEEAYVDGEIHVRPGFGRNMRALQASSLQQTANAGSKNDLLDLDTSLLGELHVVTGEAKQQSSKSISSDESPVPVALVPMTPREVTLAGSHLLSVHELGKTT